MRTNTVMRMVWVWVVLAVATVLPVGAAVDFYLKIDGVDGESVAEGHVGQIDVLAWSWGMSNSGTTHVGGGAGAGKVNVQDISFTKYVDKASPKLMLACAQGTHFPRAVLVCRKSGTDPKGPAFLTITLEDLIVTSLSTGGSGGEDRLTENVSLNFAIVKVEYVPTNPDGTTGAKVEFGWNIVQNVKI